MSGSEPQPPGSGPAGASPRGGAQGEGPRPVSAEAYTPEYFAESCGGAEFFRAFGPELLKPVQQHAWLAAGVAEGMRVLDLGCGRGELLYRVRKAGARGVGTDYAEAALALAARVSGCPVARCDAKALPFAERSFDRVFLLGVVDHLHDWELERCFAELSRVLRPGGRVLVHTCVNRLYYKNWTYRARRRAAAWLGLPAPRAPRTAEDQALHINEHSYGDLARFFAAIGWKARVACVPNWKLLARRLYGEPLPEGFPFAPAPAWRAALYLGLLFRPPLDRLLARELFAVAEPG